MRFYNYYRTNDKILTKVLESGPRVPLIPRRPELNEEVNENDGVNQKTVEQSRSASVESSFLPGTHSVYLKTWGCTHNSSDSEYMAGQLAQQVQSLGTL